MNGGGLSDTYETPGEHIYTVPENGKYKLEVWGAQGGDANYSTAYTCGYGSYSVGVININKNDILYVNVGDMGQSVNGNSGDSGTGYNGGGYASYYSDNSAHGGGGGATHIATESGLLKELSEYAGNHDSPILIVAGGGGGASSHTLAPNYSGIGGHAGGFNGNAGSPATITCYNYGTGGTQSSAGTYILCSSDGHGNGTDTHPDVAGFGYGSNYDKFYNALYYSSTGGGGGYYGGGSGNHAPGGGGSGYIGHNSLTNKAMYCYNCNTSSEESTKTYSTTDVSSEPIANYAKSGSGAARISQLEFTKQFVIEDVYGELPIPTREGYYFIGWNTKSDGSGITVTNSSTVSAYIGTLYAMWAEEEKTLFLFDNGVDNTSVTGGWSTEDWTYNSYVDNNSSSARIEDTYLYAKVTSNAYAFGAIGTVNKINVTNYNTLHITIDYIGGGGGVFLTETKGVSGDNVNYYHHPAGAVVENGTATLDLSGLSGEYYVVVIAVGSSTVTSPKTKISQLYLE